MTTLNHVSVCARDINESVRFYEDVFNMKRIPTPNFGFPVQWLQVGSIQLHLFERSDDSPVYHHVGLTADNIADVYGYAQEHSLLDDETFGNHLRELPNGTIQLYLRDPAGNLIEVNCASIDELPEDARGRVTRLIDDHPQDSEQMEAILWLDG